MLFGGTVEERLQFNEDTLWTGKPHAYHHEGAVAYLAEIRRLLAEGRQKEAEDLAWREFMSVPPRQMAYQPFGDLFLHFSGHEAAHDYSRELDLDSATITVRYRVGDVTFQRQAFASYPHQVIVVHLTASKPGQLHFTARLATPHRAASTEAMLGGVLALRGAVQEDGVRFEARLQTRVVGGTVSAAADGVTVSGADAATLLLAAHTSFQNYRDISADPGARCEATLKAAGGKEFAELWHAHQADNQRLFRRVALDLGTTPAAAHPTDARLRMVKRHPDPELEALYFQFGRYLLIASSRPGSQPANLQGIWNDQLKPPWDSKWTVNINTEMNYWPAEVTNLSECHLPLDRKSVV
jgi:alpha-L-fucosidase 2